ncbi:GNAT family N-acetyltransferase [Auritidibacter sp. NML120636]|nr:GNAT family N-acetyltransferase [Auritidibacter sp. NML120636]
MTSRKRLPHCGQWKDLDPLLCYGIARLRFQVFVMEQGVISVEELDGRDLEPGAEMWWLQDGDVPISTLRVLREGPQRIAIGRVATHRDYRGQGLAGALVQAAVAAYPEDQIELHAQAHLENWYTSLGFRREGEVFIEAEIPHVMMRRG